MAQFQEAFDVKLERYEHPKGGHYCERKDGIRIPDELQRVITAVLGPDNRPQARLRFRVHPNHVSPGASGTPETPTAPGAPMTPKAPAAPALSFTPM
jgi:kumamolisin